MKTTFKIILTLVFLFFSTATQAGQKEIHLGFQDSANFPFQIGNGEKIYWEKPGIAVELLSLVIKKLNLKVTFKRLPWKRGLAYLKSGKIDGLFNASYKKKRLEYGRYPMKAGHVDPDRRSYSNSYVLYKIKDTPVFWDGKKILNLTKAVGAVRGFSIVADLKKIGIKIEETKNTMTNFKKLLINRIDAVAALELSGDAIIRKRPTQFKTIEKLQPVLKTKDYYLMLSHQFSSANPEITEAVWDMIEIVRESQAFKQTMEKYFQ